MNDRIIINKPQPYFDLRIGLEMLAHRVLLVRPPLGYPAQVRTISLARIALEPARKTAPPPPPPPATKKPAATKATATAKTTVTTTTTKATPKATTTTIKKTVAPATRTASSLTPEQKAAKKVVAAATKQKEREKAAADRQKKKEQALKAKEKEKERLAKEREKRREQKARAKEREEEKRVQAKERERLKEERREALQKPYPPPPKRPMPGYFLFARDSSVKRQRGEGITEDSMFASEAWKALTEAEREAYNKKSEKARAQWKEDVAKWVSSLNLAQLTAARANREPGTHDGATFDTLPKRPANAFAIFVSDVYRRPDILDKVDAQAAKESGGDDTKAKRLRIGLIGRTAGDMWRSMPEREKGVYMAKAADAKKVWEKNFGHLLSAQKEAIAAAHP